MAIGEEKAERNKISCRFSDLENNSSNVSAVQTGPQTFYKRISLSNLLDLTHQPYSTATDHF